jgi:2-polyprenyl-3-methyl-5-hydroxy-6-metoxy-1,4-benzoquinol methylase
MNTESDFDAARAEAFAGHMLGVVNGGFLSLMVSIGHQTGLFDTMATCPPATSAAIATAAGLDERYVREWLGAMVSGRIVEYDAEGRTYRLPPEHAVCLTRDAAADNLAGLAQYVALLAGVEQSIVDVFRRGGGVDYAAFPRFQALMAEDSAAMLQSTLHSRTLPLVPGLVERLHAGIDVADIGCGRGVALSLMARRFPKSRFSGLDVSEEAIEWARTEARRAGLHHARFSVQDAATFGGPPAYDFITAFDAIHDQAHPRRVLRGIREALREDGLFLMVDIATSSRLEENLDNPLAPFLYSVSTMHCMTVSLAQGGEGLGTCWGEDKARELLAEAGFTRVQVTRVEGDPLNAYYVCRP